MPRRSGSSPATTRTTTSAGFSISRKAKERGSRSTAFPPRISPSTPKLNRSSESCVIGKVSRAGPATSRFVSSEKFWSSGDSALEALREAAMFVHHFPGQTIAELIKKLFCIGQFRLPVFRIYAQEFVDRFGGDFQAIQSESVARGNEADGGFLRLAAAFHALQNPLQSADIFAEAGPQEFSVRAAPEPLHMENFRGMRDALAHLQPMANISGHVLAAETQHAPGLAARDAH